MTARCARSFSVGGGVAFGLLVGGAAAQVCYRVTDVTPNLGFVIEGDVPDTVTLAINSLGEVAGAVGLGLNKHAFVWLPYANPNYPALVKGYNDLHALAGTGNPPNGMGDATGSVGLDLNNSGIVVGYRILSSGRDEAFLWTLTTPTVTTRVVGALTVPTFFSRAWGVNDFVPFQVAGLSLTDIICPVSGRADVHRGFIWNSATGVMLPLLPALLNSTGAFDINTVPPGANFSIAGTEFACFFGVLCPGLERRPARWSVALGAPLIPFALVLPQPLGFADGAGQSRAVSNPRQFAGWGSQPAPPPGGCLTRALFWEEAGGGGGGAADTVFDLHNNAQPPIDPMDRSRAEGINNLALPQVVGWKADHVTFTNRALLWEKQSSGPPWRVTDLNTRFSPWCANDNRWQIRIALDINDSGWIVALADRADIPGTQEEAVLLTPHLICTVCCDADIVPTCAVDIQDFLAVLAAWGTCPDVPDPCRADLDCDGMVGITDFNEVVAAFGQPCGPAGFAGPVGSGSQEALEQALMQLGFADVDAFGAWLETADPAAVAAVAEILALLLGGG